MSTTELGSAFQPKVGAAGQAGFMEGLVATIVAQVVKEIGVQRPPTVNVAPAQVRVAAPDVTVTPTFTVNERETEAPVVNVNVSVDEFEAALQANTAALEALHGDMMLLAGLLQRPVTKTVERGNGGLITTVTETRG